MSARIRRRPAARSDVLKIAAYIAKENVEAGLRFARAVRETEELLAATPGIGAPRDFSWPELAGMRSHSVKGFRNHIIFCVPREGGIEVVRVLHGARDWETLFGGGREV
jgi:toxin ParE1/3/4